MRETRPILTADALLARYPDDVRALVGTLRDIVRLAVPGGDERVYPGWRAIGFRHPDVGYFCGLFPHDDGVNVAFERGVRLVDPTDILEPAPGGSTGVRCVRYSRGARPDPAPLTALLLQAVALPRMRLP